MMIHTRKMRLLSLLLTLCMVLPTMSVTAFAADAEAETLAAAVAENAADTETPETGAVAEAEAPKADAAEAVAEEVVDTSALEESLEELETLSTDKKYTDGYIGAVKALMTSIKAALTNAEVTSEEVAELVSKAAALKGAASEPDNQKTLPVEVDASLLPTGIKVTATDGTNTVEVSGGGSNAYLNPVYGGSVTFVLSGSTIDNYTIAPKNMDINSNYSLSGEEKDDVNATKTWTLEGVVKGNKVGFVLTRKDVEGLELIKGKVDLVGVSSSDLITNDKELTIDGVKYTKGRVVVGVKKAMGTYVTLKFNLDTKIYKAFNTNPVVGIDGVDYAVTVSGNQGSIKVPVNELIGVSADDLWTAITGSMLPKDDALQTYIDEYLDNSKGIVDGEDKYDITNGIHNGYTQATWNALKNAYDNAVKVLANGKATDAAKLSAMESLKKAYLALVPQYEVVIPSDFEYVKSGSERVVTVKDIDDVVYVARGGNVVLKCTIGDGLKVSRVTYATDTAPYSYVAVMYDNGLFSIPVTVDLGAGDISYVPDDKGFAVNAGALGDATGKVGDDNASFVISPNGESSVAYIVIDGAKIDVPEHEVIAAIAEAIDADNWSSTNSFTSKNGKVTFTKNSDDVIYASNVPELGRIKIEGTCVTVLGTTECGLLKGSELDVEDGELTAIRPAETTGKIGTVSINFNYNRDVIIHFGENSGSHSITAGTDYSIYSIVTEDAKAKVSAATAVHGGKITITVGAPADTASEVGMGTTFTGTFNGIEGTIAIRDMEGVTVKMSGRAAILTVVVTGDIFIESVDVEFAAKGQNATDNKVASEIKTLEDVLEELETLLDTEKTGATDVKANDGAIYDETSNAWKKLFVTDNIYDKAVAVRSDLESIVLGGYEDSDELLGVLSVTAKIAKDAEYKSVSSATSAIKTLVSNLKSNLTSATRYYADGVVNITTSVAIGSVGMLNTAKNTMNILPDTGKINPNGGNPIIVSNIQVEYGYLPKVTVIGGNNTRTFTVGDSYDLIDVDSDGTYMFTIANSDLKDLFGDSKGKVGNITSIKVTGVKQGILIPTDAALEESLKVGGVSAAVGGVTVAGDVTKGESATIIADEGVATITFTLSQDDYTTGGTWYKKLVGVEVGGTLYSVSGSTFKSNRAKVLAGVTFTKTGNTVSIKIDTKTVKADLETLAIVTEPTNTQYTTFKSEFEQVGDIIGSSATKTQLERGIKLVKKLLAETDSTNVLVQNHLNTENARYLTSSIAQLNEYSLRLDSMYKVETVEESVTKLYDQINKIVPFGKTMTNAGKIAISAMADVINAAADEYNALTEFEKSLFSSAVKVKLEKCINAIAASMGVGNSKTDKYIPLAEEISTLAASAIDETNADILGAMIDSAEKIYDAMSDSEKGRCSVEKKAVDAAKTVLDAYAKSAAAAFVATYNVTALKNSNTLIEAKHEYDELSLVVRNAIDSTEGYVNVVEEYKKAFNISASANIDNNAVVDNFVKQYLTVGGNIITSVDADNYAKILTGNNAYKAYGATIQKKIDNKLNAAKSGLEFADLVEAAELAAKLFAADGESKLGFIHKLTDDEVEEFVSDKLGINKVTSKKDYDQAVKDVKAARDFIKKNLLTSNGSVITSSNSSTIAAIKGASAAYNKLSDAAKTIVNTALSDSSTYNGKSYPTLLNSFENGVGGTVGGEFGSSKDIVIPTTYNGVVTVNKSSAAVGERVIITAKPAVGYALKTLIVLDAKGAGVTLYGVGDNRFVFIMPANKPVRIAAEFARTVSDECDGNNKVCPSYKFDDVNPFLWYHAGIDFAVANRLMKGISDNSFNPDGTTTRAMIVTILYRLEGSPKVDLKNTFSDVESGAWFEAAIEWAAAYKIVEGVGEGKFAPNADITREQMAAILYRFAQYKHFDVSTTETLNKYSDRDSISTWAMVAMRWANDAGLIQGMTETTLAPRGTATRAQVATILMRFCATMSR